ncbi:replication-associated protein [Antarctic virus 2_I_GPYANKsw002Ad]|nr:replication-associated protein [Antarctic virus 2_I_GPYANKsw001Ad]QNG41103.1 replication-associated protein [Antarctic virus 2_I_GPYANKsw001Ch]QNG41105.1 replication-associated protein [Antarctic virus 2_I_GPYANKsw002Ad]QNG41107.1 replication-associated protein [Antarctic virus 2_I_GPYANKsw003Ad]QNG41109.1 replication-associated protein [Antarctic virus 2_I_GPYANKsw004Ad]
MEPSVKPEFPSHPKNKHWSITYNNPKHTQEEFFHLLSTAYNCVYAVVQQEKVETVHFQCCIGFKNQTAFNTVQKLIGKGIHIDPSRNAMAAFKYCQKDASRVAGTKPMVFGIPLACKNVAGDTAARTKLLLELGPKAAIDEGLIPFEKLPQLLKAYAAYEGLIKKPALEGFKNEWHWGVPGSGKSYQARERFPDAYLKTKTKWWDGYLGEETVIIEEMSPDKIGASHMKEWADIYDYACEGKGTTTRIRPKRIIVTSNYSIEQCWPNPQDHDAIKRRFEVHEYKDPFKIIKN